jgi:crossover junction endodeoxyribonuclease RuvC
MSRKYKRRWERISWIAVFLSLEWCDWPASIITLANLFLACFDGHRSIQIFWRGYVEGRRLVAVSGNDGRKQKPAFLRVLGVDPAAAGPTGYGVVESDGRNARMVHYGALFITAKRRKESAGAALQDVHALLSRLIEEYKPDAVAVEAVFAALNVRTALRLAEVRGVVLLAAAQHNVVVHSYSPREVKSSVAGYGHADKRQVQEMVRALLTMQEIPEPSDAADALAVALCHLQAEQTRRRFSLPVASKQSRRARGSAVIDSLDAVTRGVAGVATGSSGTYSNLSSCPRIVPTR